VCLDETGSFQAQKRKEQTEKKLRNSGDKVKFGLKEKELRKKTFVKLSVRKVPVSVQQRCNNYPNLTFTILL